MKFKKLKSLIKSHIKNIGLTDDKNKSFRINSFNKVINVIDANYDDDETVTIKKIQDLDLTQSMKETLLNWKNNKQEEKKPNELLLELSKIAGIGKERGMKLIKDGVKSIKDLYKKKYFDYLNEDTKTYLKYKPTPTKHEVLEKFKKIIDSCGVKYNIVGSYRRLKPVSNDLDIIVYDIEEFLNALGKLVPIYPYARGKFKHSVIIDLNKIEKNKFIKMDIFKVNKENEIPMILYSTGSKLFNIIMRKAAKKKGLLLNQNGLYKLADGDSKRISGLKTEKDYFDYIGMEYLTPEKRN